jgi:hypothetical protein
MAVAEIAAGITSIRAALDITKAMVNLRDEEAFRAKSIELQGVVLDALENAIEAREAHTLQADRIRALEAEVAQLKDWATDKQNYELRPIGNGGVGYMLKPDKRGSETPHWLCPTCFAKGQKSFLLPTGNQKGRGWTCQCAVCRASSSCDFQPHWVDERE